MMFQGHQQHSRNLCLEAGGRQHILALVLGMARLNPRVLGLHNCRMSLPLVREVLERLQVSSFRAESSAHRVVLIAKDT